MAKKKPATKTKSPAEQTVSDIRSFVEPILSRHAIKEEDRAEEDDDDPEDEEDENDDDDESWEDEDDEDDEDDDWDEDYGDF